MFPSLLLVTSTSRQIPITYLIIMLPLTPNMGKKGTAILCY